MDKHLLQYTHKYSFLFTSVTKGEEIAVDPKATPFPCKQRSEKGSQTRIPSWVPSRLFIRPCPESTIGRSCVYVFSFLYVYKSLVVLKENVLNFVE